MTTSKHNYWQEITFPNVSGLELHPRDHHIMPMQGGTKHKIDNENALLVEVANLLETEIRKKT